jgi:hypothetical protein
MKLLFASCATIFDAIQQYTILKSWSAANHPIVSTQLVSPCAWKSARAHTVPSTAAARHEGMEKHCIATDATGIVRAFNDRRRYA